MVKKRSVSGNVGIGMFVISFICVVVAFFSKNWLVSDHRINGAKLERLGLWTHCFRSLPDPQDVYERRFFVGCRWIYDPFTAGYKELLKYLLPPFIIVTQFFYTLALIGALACFILVILFFLCFVPEQKYFLLLVTIIGGVMVAVGVCSVIAVSVFAIFANRDNWMPGPENNFFGWSFGVAIVGAIASLITGGLFLTELTVQKKKRKYLKESQSHFEMEQETKA